MTVGLTNAFDRLYVDALRARPDVALQVVGTGATHAWYVFAFRHPRRDALMAALGKRGVQARVVYPHALHQDPAYAQLSARAGEFPGAEGWAKDVADLMVGEGERACQREQRIFVLSDDFGADLCMLFHLLPLACVVATGCDVRITVHALLMHGRAPKYRFAR